ncbi:hypothetical protein DL95DRAFT_499205 [Leptodontidium sp. 2 PMI_412]|nr:hypothetical protein DL95DRAFT_499205 [Leptodontidium sp. 2 PMI_412]
MRTRLFRCWIDAFDENDYVALSYTWSRSEYEDQSSGRYEVQTRDRKQFFSSPVRDCVFDRVIKYMRKFNLKFLWVDRHSIRQKTCKQVVCDHRVCNQKRAALQTMDLVYKLSNHPVALLGRPIESRDKLNLLARILAGELVNGDQETRQFQLSRGTSHVEAGNAMRLLKKITDDLWWTRAWTFQENYRARKKMTLLVRHPPSLEMQKRQYGLFGDVPDELCINSVNFSYEATRLCFAFQRIQPQTREDREARNHVLSTTGKYTLLLEGSDSMTPTIIADIEKRSLTDPWDRLAITANCCQYQIRLSIGGLLQKAQSRSLSMLTMCLLNGEIPHNSAVEATQSSVPQMTVSRYLKAQFFNEFYAPKDELNLTFNKGCRFMDVELKASGIMTKGHLWKLGRVIRTATFSRRLPWVEDPSGSLTLHQQKRLTQLANKLRSLSHTLLANQIEAYLCRDSFHKKDEQSRDTTFPKSYLRMMAVELVTAMDKGKTLRLGSIWGAMETVTPYTAIFIWEGDEHEDGDTEGTGDEESDVDTEDKESQDSSSDESDRRQRVLPAFVFTASRPKKPRSGQHDANDIDRHVSLEVECAGLTRQINGCVPRLYIKRWLLGLCFFWGYPRMDVIFPWPPALDAIGR